MYYPDCLFVCILFPEIIIMTKNDFSSMQNNEAKLMCPLRTIFDYSETSSSNISLSLDKKLPY